MSYGNGQKGLEVRACDAGRSPTTPTLDALRVGYLRACQAHADAVWPASPLHDLFDGRALDDAMLATQADMRGILNSIWAQEARLSAKTAVIEQHGRARRNLCGRMLQLGTVGDEPVTLPDGRRVRRILNLPPEWSGLLSDADLAALTARTANLSFDDCIDLLWRVANGTSDLPHLHADALQAMVDDVAARFDCPRWDTADATAQLRLTWSAVQGTRRAWPALKADLEDALWASLATGMPWTVGFALTSQMAFGPCEPVAALLTHRTTRRHVEPAAGPVTLRGVSVDVGPRDTVVRVLLASEPQVRDPLGCRHVLGRDHGYRNTVSWTLVRVPDTGISQAALDLAARVNAMADVNAAKSEARAYLESHVSDAEPVLQATMSGRSFLAAVARHCAKVDVLRREIDRIYERVHRLKHEVNAALGVSDDALVDLDAEHGDPRLSRWVARLGRLLAGVARLKEGRRAAYRAVDGLKRSWFGHLANVEAELAKEYDALVVRERLTTKPLEVDAPEYKGRTFNRVMSNGSRARFEDAAEMKHKWCGNPVVSVPSHYTSTTDHRYAVVDAAQRRGEWFTARIDGVRWDSDAHASHTLAVWLMMVARAVADEGGAGDDGALPLAA